MSISLPNGTLLANPATQTQYTAAVTRILHLSSFPAELKTRDLQVMFKDYEAEKGGFRIKWVDDVNALVVFADAGVAKRAYLSFLLSPPAAFPPPAKIRPYDRPDAAQIIQALTARSMGHRASMSSALSGQVFGAQAHAAQQSIDGLPQVHTRAMSMSSNPTPTSGSGSGSSAPAATSGMGVFAFPKSSRSSISSTARIGQNHGRTGSSSFSRASGSFGALNFGNPSSATSNGGGGRLATHAENLDSPGRPSAPFPVRRTTRESDLSRSASSSDTEPIVVMDHAPNSGSGFVSGATQGGNAGIGFGQWKMPSSKVSVSAGAQGAVGGSTGGRRESHSAEKAMREVEKALAGVEARG